MEASFLWGIRSAAGRKAQLGNWGFVYLGPVHTFMSTSLGQISKAHMLSLLSLFCVFPKRMPPSRGNDALAKDVHVEMLDDPIKPGQADQVDIENRAVKERQLVRRIDIRMLVTTVLYAKVQVQLLTLT